MTVLPPEFFARPTPDVAHDLIGHLLVHEHPAGARLIGRIVETEAYTQDEPACHAWNVVDARGRIRRKRRGASLFGPPGRAYIYLNYGLYWLLNVVTEPEGRGAAVLIRAIEPTEGRPFMRERRPAARADHDLTNGPGKLVLAMDIKPELHERMLTEPPLYFSRGETSGVRVGSSSRIGISRAASLPWRFFEEGNPFVSPGIPSKEKEALRRRLGTP